MLLHSTIIVLKLLSLNVLSIESAKILGIFVVPSRSHQSMHEPIVKGLAAKGHDVTIISHFKSNDTIPNYTEILLPKPPRHFVDSITIDESVKFIGLMNQIAVIENFVRPFCELLFNLDFVKELINSKCKCKKIDLIIADVHHKHCHHLLAHKLNVTLILVSPPSLSTGIDYFLGNSYNPSITPLVMSPFTTKMNFWQRLVNSVQFTFLYWYQIYKCNEDMPEFAHNVFNMELPSPEELNRRTALAFYNNHPSFISRPKSPNVIDIAGIHIKEPKKLPKDVEAFINGSAQGVIFFSFGSTIKASSIHPEKMKIFVDVFSSIPQRVIWRVDELNISNVPSNVKLGKWFPQRDILEHKNVIAFISHCGMFGTLEAIHTATPVIGIPFMYDQFLDINILVEKGAGIYVDYYTLHKNTLSSAINEIVTNSKYRENMQKLSEVFKDRPMTPLDEAIYWTEYVLKHQGAPHLRTAAADMPLYQYLLLDVILAFLFIVVITIYILKCFVKITISVLFKKEKKKNKTQ